MGKYLVEVNVNGNKYKKYYRSNHKKSTDKGYAYARKVSKKNKGPWTFLHIGKVEKKKKSNRGLPF